MEEYTILELPQEWKGAEVLKDYLVWMDKLEESVGNPRRGNVEAIAASLSRFGQVRPILLKSDGITIIAGHHLVKAAVSLGWTRIAAIQAEFNSDAEARAYLLADNRLSEIGWFEQTQQLSMIDEIGETNLAGTGYTIDDIEDLRAEVAVPETAMVEWEGTAAESEALAAERAARLGAAVPMKDVVMLLTMDQHSHFLECVRVLRTAYGTTGIIDTILRAIEKEAIAAGMEVVSQESTEADERVVESESTEVRERAGEPDSSVAEERAGRTESTEADE